MNTISFNTANFVAREVGFNMTQGWGEGDKASNDYFRPVETFAARFRAMLSQISNLGFTSIDLWTAHLNYTWATLNHIETAKSLLADHEITVVSYAGGFGNSADELSDCCALCKSLDIPILGGGMPLLQSHRTEVVSILREYGLVYGYENHPEKSANDVLMKIGDDNLDIIGIALDTGWFGTQGVEVPAAIHKLGTRIKHVHLKDVKARRSQPTGYQMIDMGHETCILGDGIVSIKRCVAALLEIGYTGGLSIEHEPEDFDPSDNVKLSKERVEEWLAK